MTESLESIEQAVSPEPEAKSVPVDDEMLSKATVSKIIERERQKAIEKGRREVLMELEQNQQQQMPQEQMQQQQPPMAQPVQRQNQGLGGMQQMSQQDIEQLIMQKAPEALMQQFNQMQQTNMVDSFVGKMQTAEQRYPGLEQKLNKLNYDDPRMHKLIEMTDKLENTGDVMNELVSNPAKMMQVLASIKEQPYLGQETLNALSNSIKQNQVAAAENSQANEPMSKLKPSINTGLADSSQLSVMDLRRQLSQKHRR